MSFIGNCIKQKLANIFHKLPYSHLTPKYVIHSKFLANCQFHTTFNKRDSEDSNESKEDFEKIIEDPPFLKESELRKLYKENLLVLQPKVKWGPKKLKITTPELQIAESVALAETLPNWNVIEQIIVPMQNQPDKKEYFGKGKLEELIGKVNSLPNLTAVFVAVDRLSGLQYNRLTQLFGCRVYDRYNVVLHIFRDHASTGEAKLQIALAEIPYIRARIRDTIDQNQPGYGRTNYQRSGQSYLQIKKDQLKMKESKLRQALENLRQQRGQLCKQRKKSQIPVVAVVGYTNAGKTTLIRSLTGDKSLTPQNHLFATLDVTVHRGQLASSLQPVYYIDTVGFLSNLPINLIASFQATLEDIFLADLLIHIQDASHPDLQAQTENVLQTLQALNPDPKLLESMLTTANKVDLLPEDSEPLPEGTFPISATKGWGLDRLNEEIEQRIMASTGLSVQHFRVPNGQEAFHWLRSYCGLKSVEPCPDDPNFLLVTSVMSPANLGRFKHRFAKWCCSDNDT